MSEFILGGSVDSALWHFAGYGLAAIAEDSGVRNVQLHWDDSATPELRISGDTDEWGQLVRKHAERASSPTHWLSARRSQGPREGAALFSPRIKASESHEEWASYLREREEHLDRVVSRLDRALIGGLGQPAHWRHTAKENLPDSGASRWEMKTRNKGEEFVQHRLSPLAGVLADRREASIEAGLAGEVVIDKLGNRADSRTATGFRLPGETDSAVAWCALWGLSWLPVVHLAGSMSQTPGAFPRVGVHPKQMVLPVFIRATSPARWRSVLVSYWMDLAAFGPARSAERALVDSARRWLETMGVAALVRLPVDVRGSKSAPERVVLDGDIEVLGSET